MSTNDRDTHFKGWAALTWEDIGNKLEFWIDTAEPNFKEELLQIIAQRAYDLAWHVLKTAEEHDLFANDFYGRFSLDTEAKLTEIPDLTEWPTPD